MGTYREKAAIKSSESLIPMKKLGMPEDIAKLAAFLADNDQSGFITGTDYLVDGGSATRGGYKVIKGNRMSDLIDYDTMMGI